MSQRRILVVEDERAIREMVCFNLGRAGYSVSPVADAREARAAIADQRPDLVLMDWMLPDISGLELTRQLKRDPETKEIPVIMLTARGEEDDRVAGLDGGADDYIVKPFAPRELLARIRAALRRLEAADAEVVSAGTLKLDSAGHRVSAGGVEVALGPTEYRLLEFFMRHPDRVYSRTQLLDRVWGGNVYVEERTVDVHIRRLRKALTPTGHDQLIRTVRGAGYRFSAGSS
jgi:two-component system phosphate regulon response regulator PhoB